MANAVRIYKKADAALKSGNLDASAREYWLGVKVSALSAIAFG